MTPARLAIVDDDPQFVKYVGTLLGSRGYDVETFSSGADLLKALHGAQSPDVVLLDVLMPGMDGLETLRAIRTAHPGVQVIMLSGRQVPETIVDAVRLGAVDYVVKPGDPEGLGEAALEAAIRNAVEKVVLTNELDRLRAQGTHEPEGGQAFWGTSQAMRQIMTLIERVADSDVSVLLRGESGVGKEVIARELHRRSPRAGKPFVKVNCAALPADLLESELFGHERGAFTGAQATRVGKFEYASEGTIMLDEIGEMPASLQAKILHVLQDREFTKLGSNRPVVVDSRVLAATNRDLNQMMRSGQFREDLYYRLQVIELHVPPLRERQEEIPALIEFFLRKYSVRYGRGAVKPSPALREALLGYSWPGNVRELENVLKRFVILQDESLVLAELRRSRSSGAPNHAAEMAHESVMSPSWAPAPLPVFAAAPAASQVSSPEVPVSRVQVPAEPEPDAEAPMPPSPPTLPGSLPEVARRAAMEAEREAIQQALDHFRWNRRKAAQLLGVSYKTLLNKMKECGITAAKE